MTPNPYPNLRPGGRPWTAVELTTLRRMRVIECQSYAAIGAVLGRTALAVQVRLGKRGWKMPREAVSAARSAGARRRWDAVREVRV